ncbi:MAG: hypothetical protein WC942_11955 [Clostridia bacterium]|jgi:hypothetical protein
MRYLGVSFKRGKVIHVCDVSKRQILCNEKWDCSKSFIKEIELRVPKITCKKCRQLFKEIILLDIKKTPTKRDFLNLEIDIKDNMKALLELTELISIVNNKVEQLARIIASHAKVIMAIDRRIPLRIFQCNSCGKRFPLKTGEKGCPFCGGGITLLKG